MTFIPETALTNQVDGQSISSLELLKAMVDAAQDPIAVKDRNLVYLACNTAFLQMLGKSEREVIGHTDADLVQEGAVELCRLSDRQVLKTGEIVSREECTDTPQGRRCFHVIKRPLRNSVGSIDGVVMVTHDITERKQAEESVGLQADRYRTLLNTTVDGFWLVDSNGALLDVNKGYCNMSGYSREELLSMSIPDLEAKETLEETAQHIQAIIKSGFDRFATRHRRKDGTIIDVEISTSFLAHRGEFLAFCRDITERTRAEAERRRYEAELQHARRQAEYESEAKTRFLATASHDLRQPIQAMHLLADLLVNTELPPESAEIAFRVQEAVEGLGEMLTALLDISKLDAGLVTPECSEFPINDLLLQLVDEHLPLARERGIELRCVRSSAFVRSDFNLLTRILRNLISNAIKYTSSGGILVGVRRAGEFARLQVMDTGCGIDEDELVKVFDEFHQLGNRARDRREGLGLGLAIVKRLATLLDHPVDVVSQPGRGTCFSVLVPLAQASEYLHAWLPDENPEGSVPYEGAEILVVDDEIDIREGLKMNLAQWGYAVSVAADFEQAMAAINDDNPPVLVIADYRLGSKTGIEVIQEVRRRLRRKIEALLLTGDVADERRREAAMLGVQLLRKPVSGAQLRRTIVDVLGKAR